MTVDELNEVISKTERAFHFAAWLRTVGAQTAAWSSGMYRLLGVHPSVPPSHDLYLDAIHPEDRYREPAESMADGRSGEHRQVRLRRTGVGYSVFDVHTRYLRQSIGGSGLQIGVVFDVGNAKQADIALRHLLAQIAGPDHPLDQVARHDVPQHQTKAIDPNKPIGAALIRAARGLLDWTLSDLATASGLSMSTIRRAEALHHPRVTSMPVIREALEKHGVQFVEVDGLMGVLLLPSAPDQSKG